MKKKIIISLLITLLLVFAVAGSASATPPSSVNGSYVILGVTDVDATFQMFGTAEGIFVQTFSPGRADKGWFTGTIEGSDVGTVMFNVVSATEHNLGHFTSLAGTGTAGLWNAHIEGTFTPDETGFAGTYTAWFHFDP